jgi:hypothetical protein
MSDTRTAIPHYSSLDRVVVFVFHQDLRRGSRYDHLRTPERVMRMIDERYGVIVGAQFLTRYRVSKTKHLNPRHRKTEEEIVKWVEAGCIPEIQLPEALQLRVLLTTVEQLRPNVIVLVGSPPREVLYNLRLSHSETRVVVISNETTARDYMHADESQLLLDFLRPTEQNAERISPVPSAPTGDLLADAVLYARQTPVPPLDTNVFQRLEWTDPELHERIGEFLDQETASKASAPGLLYQQRLGTLPDVLLAVLLVVAEMPSRDVIESNLLDQQALLDGLKRYGATSSHRAGLDALAILTEVGILWKEPKDAGSTFDQLAMPGAPKFVYALLRERLPSWSKVRQLWNLLRLQHKMQMEEFLGIEELLEDLSRGCKGQEFLNMCLGALEVWVASPAGRSKTTLAYWKWWQHIRTLSGTERREAYEHFGVLDLRVADRFEERARRIIAAGTETPEAEDALPEDPAATPPVPITIPPETVTPAAVGGDVPLAS